MNIYSPSCRIKNGNCFPCIYSEWVQMLSSFKQDEILLILKVVHTTNVTGSLNQQEKWIRNASGSSLNHTERYCELNQPIHWKDQTRMNDSFTK